MEAFPLRRTTLSAGNNVNKHLIALFEFLLKFGDRFETDARAHGQA